jgi:hypothetical protein
VETDIRAPYNLTRVSEIALRLNLRMMIVE